MLKTISLNDELLKAINDKSIESIMNILYKLSNNDLSINNLKDIANTYSIKHEDVTIGKENKYDAELWYILDEHIISFSGSYNDCDILYLKNVTIFDKTDSIIVEKNV